MKIFICLFSSFSCLCGAFCDKCRPAIWTLTALFHNSVPLDSYSSGCQHELWFHISRRQTGKDTDDLIFSPGNWTSAIRTVNYWMLTCNISVTNGGVKQILEQRCESSDCMLSACHLSSLLNDGSLRSWWRSERVAIISWTRSHIKLESHYNERQ